MNKGPELARTQYRPVIGSWIFENKKIGVMPVFPTKSLLKCLCPIIEKIRTVFAHTFCCFRRCMDGCPHLPSIFYIASTNLTPPPLRTTRYREKLRLLYICKIVKKESLQPSLEVKHNITHVTHGGLIRCGFFQPPGDTLCKAK